MLMSTLCLLGLLSDTDGGNYPVNSAGIGNVATIRLLLIGFQNETFQLSGFLDLVNLSTVAM